MPEMSSMILYAIWAFVCSICAIRIRQQNAKIIKYEMLIVAEDNKNRNLINMLDNKIDTLQSCVYQYSNTKSLTNRVECIEKELDTYLDKTFMLTGFEPSTGLPYYTTNYDENNEIVTRDNLTHQWNSPSGSMAGHRFVVEQFATLGDSYYE